MWIEAILTKDDLDRLLTQALPLTIALGDSGDHIALAQPRGVQFLVDQGVRVQCEAKVRWSVLGINVPLTIHDVRVMLRPRIEKSEAGRDVLLLEVFVEHADFAGIPTMIDEKITDKINAAIKAKQSSIAWDFSQMLTRTVGLPAALEPARTLALAVAWGKVKITDEALVLAVSFHADVKPGSVIEAVVGAPTALAAPKPTNGNGALTHHDVHALRTQGVLALSGSGALALVLGSAYGALRVAARERRTRERNSLLFSVATIGAASIAINVGVGLVRALVRRA